MALRRPPQILPAAAAALLALSCGGGGASTPSATTPVATPTPVASSSPLPDSGASASSCPLGMGDVTAACSKTSPQLTAAVEAAIDRLVRERPALFNMNDEQGGGGQYRVLDAEAYLDGLVANLRAAGLCAERSLDRERIVVKSSNAFSEEWDVLSSQGFIRRASYAYQQSCTPASFPVDRRGPHRVRLGRLLLPRVQPGDDRARLRRETAAAGVRRLRHGDAEAEERSRRPVVDPRQRRPVARAGRRRRSSASIPTGASATSSTASCARRASATSPSAPPCSVRWAA